MIRIYPDRRATRFLIGAILLALPVALSACGAQGTGDQRIAGTSLTIFSGLPLSGPLKPVAESMVKAEKLAVQEGKGKAGKFTINYISLNDADRSGLTKELVAQNSRKVAREGKAIAYIGGLTSVASSVALPILNQDDILFVSPSSSAVGLTKVFPGAKPGEPEVYYVSGKRNFVRIAPTDDVVANAAAKWAKRLKARRVVAVADNSVYGSGLVRQFVEQARKVGVEVVSRLQLRSQEAGSTALADKVSSAKPDVVFYGGYTSPAIADLFKTIHSAVPDAELLTAAGRDGLLNSSFNSRLGQAGASTYLISSILDPKQLPASGKRFIKRYRSTFRQSPDRYAVYAYATMNLIRDSIRRAGKNASDRRKLIDQVFNTKNYSSPVGKFSIDENGDTNLKEVAGYRVRDGRPIFSRSLRG